MSAARGAHRPTARGGATTAAGRPKRPRSKAEKAAQARAVWEVLAERYPDAFCELDHRNAYELLAATILSAQCTDKRVNMVTPALFRAYPDAASLAAARQEDVEAIVQSTGFFRSKAKNLIGMAGALVDRHGGEVPADMDALTPLPGVGRKTANVVLGNAFGINVGVVVDTHVGRIAKRLGLTSHDDPIKVERDLMALFPADDWTLLSHRFIWHGRRLCDARKPKCGECPLAARCPSVEPA
ncbi:MAG: endonuclease III [Gemmatimonadaceae bacterium]|nr:endonuclease III [Gemmatimonadaceae bacterium]